MKIISCAQGKKKGKGNVNPHKACGAGLDGIRFEAVGLAGDGTAGGGLYNTRAGVNTNLYLKTRWLFRDLN